MGFNFSNERLGFDMIKDKRQRGISSSPFPIITQLLTLSDKKIRSKK